MTPAPRSRWLLAGFVAGAAASLFRGSATQPADAIVLGLIGAALALVVRRLAR